MDALQRILFEEPAAGVIGLLIIALPLAPLLWRKRGASRLLPLIPLGLAGLLLAVATAVQTEREKVQDVLQRAGRAIEADKLDDLADLLSEDFAIQAGGDAPLTGKTQALELVRVTRNIYPIRGVKFDKMQVSVRQGAASADLTAITKAASGHMADLPIPSEWTISLARLPNGRWVIVNAELRKVQGQSARGVIPLSSSLLDGVMGK